MQAGLLVAAFLIPGTSAFATDASPEALWSALERPGQSGEAVILRRGEGGSFQPLGRLRPE
jgi:hypothetical protein